MSADVRPVASATEDYEHIREFGRLENLIHIDREFEPKVLQSPLIHQYLKGGYIYRSRKGRPVDQFELFLDLLMVGVVHTFADTAAEAALEHEETGLAIVRFVLTFWAAWSTWTDYRDYINMSGMDDLPQRLYTFVVMGVLLGFASNATAIELIQSGYEERKTPLRASLAFFLVGKLFRIILHAFYGVYLREFFLAELSQVLKMLVSSAFFLASMWPSKLYVSAVLFGVGALVEILGPLMKVPFAKTISTPQTAGEKSGESGTNVMDLRNSAVPALNIEHFAERNGEFYTIVLGESVASLIYDVALIPEAAGINKFYARALMGLMVTYCFNWLYFTRDWKVQKRHPIRSHWFSAWVYMNLHWPLCAALNIASAGVARLVTSAATDNALRWYWGGGLATALVCLVILDLSYKWDFWTPLRRIVMGTRIFFRIGGAVICALVPLSDIFDDLNFLGIYAGLLVFLVAEELVGKLLLYQCTPSAEQHDPSETREFEVKGEFNLENALGAEPIAHEVSSGDRAMP